jgi:dolichyl-phosphate-mannose--protein O-mannosyl transferase
VSRRGALVSGLLFAAGLALYLPRLAVPDTYIFDEVYHAYTAGQYAAGNADAYVWYTHSPRPGVAYMWNHPPLGIHLIALGIRLWGDHSFGWRFMSALFGALGLVVAFWLARALTGDATVALLATGLLMMDGLYFVQARTGMLDSFGVFFMMSALLLFHRFWTAPPERAGQRLPWIGLLLGLAIATKWNAAYASLMIGLAALVRLAWRSRPMTRLVADLAWLAFGLVIVPALIYFLAYVPFLLTGHSLAQLVELQKQIFYYHSHLKATHPYQSSWWQWPLVIRPVWYHVQYGKGWMANTYALANPLLHWALLPAVLWLVWWWGRRAEAALLTVVIGFFGQWLPWVLVPRISFAYHFLPAVPFGCIALAVALSRLVAHPGPRRWLACTYVGLVVAAFVFFYPIYSSLPLKYTSFALRMWLPTWR